MRSVGIMGVMVLASATAAAAAPPDWVRQALASAPAGNAAAVVFLDEVHVTVSPDGKLRTSRRYVVRVNDRAARDTAAFRELYLTGSGKVRGMRAWVVRADGQSRDLGERESADVALVNNDVFNEVRARVISTAEDMRPGDAFAAEAESDDRILYSQLEWPLQDRWPVTVVRRLLTLPPGWRATTVAFNAAALQPRQQGDTLIWEVRDLPEIPDEPGRPPLSDLVPRLAVSFFAASPSAALGQFERWSEVSAWLHALSTAQRPSPAVAAKARELTSAAVSDLERIASIAAFVQRIQYVSIQTGVGRGGGYQPRPAALVLERNYGDCKDKAGLMRDLLAAVGVEAYLVAIYSDDRNYVRAEWPSPQQFNHAIVAVSTSGAAGVGASTLEHPAHGRLLLFDPTDEHTRLGDLPLHLHGSAALLISPAGGELFRVPPAAPGANRLARTIDGALDASGTLTAAVRERFSGALARDERALNRGMETGAYRAAVARRAAAAIPRARVQVTEAGQQPDSNVFAVAFDLTATGFSLLQGSLLLVAPPFVAAESLRLSGTRPRRTPLILEGQTVVERVSLRLPAGYGIDEIPKGVELDGPFGRYALAYTDDAGVLVATRELDVPLQTIPPEQYSLAHEFFERVRGADAAFVVLKRK